jgi:hypothetical protein
MVIGPALAAYLNWIVRVPGELVAKRLEHLMAPKKKLFHHTRTGRFRAEWRQSGRWIVFLVSVMDLILDPAIIWRKSPPKVDAGRAAIPRAKTGDPGMRNMEVQMPL